MPCKVHTGCGLQRNTQKVKKADILLILVCLLVSGAAALGFWLFAPVGDTVTVTVEGGDEAAAFEAMKTFFAANL